MDLPRSPGALLRNLSKVLLDGSRALQAAQKKEDYDDADESVNEENDILERANKVQKAMKSCVKGNKKLKGKDEEVLIAVCRMTESKEGLFTRGKSPLIEIKANKSDSYETFVSNAARKCQLQIHPRKTLHLFKMSGARILNESVSVNGKSRPWTVGNYLSMLRKGAASIKMGVGSTSVPDRIDLSVSDDEVPSCSYSHSTLPTTRQLESIESLKAAPSGQMQTVTDAKTRIHIWTYDKKKEYEDIGVYQPETDGFEVLSIHHGSTLLLTYKSDTFFNFVKFVVKFPKKSLVRNSNKPMVVWQSPTSITVSSFRKAATLYCVASNHGTCTYHWKKHGWGRSTFPSSPVVYVNEGGVYQCIIQTENAEEVSSRTIRVHVNIASSDSELANDKSPPTKKLKSQLPVQRQRGIRSLWESTAYYESSTSSEGEEDGNINPVTANVSHLPDNSTMPVDNSHGLSLKSAGDNFPQQVQVKTVERSASQQIGESSCSNQVQVKTVERSASQQIGESSCTNQVREFTEDELKIATDNFSVTRRLGDGGFGTVYRGYMNGTNLAIKKLTEDRAVAQAVRQGIGIPDKYRLDGQLNCEMWALTRCRHRNLVDLVGFCSKPPVLIYEFMEEGNFYDRLFKKKHPPLLWKQRSSILKDVCRGLAWLHATVPPIIHGDVKMTNVLIDRHLTAKLGDFGFSQEFAQVIGGRSFVTAAVVAKSLGYSPPEMDTCRVSPKSDVYSYGVVALEAYTGMKAYCSDREDVKLTDFFDDDRKTLEGYKKIADKEAGELAPYLLLLYQKIIENCLLKHSKRLNSAQIMEIWETTNF